MIRGVDKLGRTALKYAACHGFHEEAEHISESMDGASMINILCGRDGGIIPILEAVKRDDISYPQSVLSL